MRALWRKVSRREKFLGRGMHVGHQAKDSFSWFFKAKDSLRDVIIGFDMGH